MRLDTFPSDMQGTSPPEECVSPRAALFHSLCPQDRRASAKHLESLPRGPGTLDEFLLSRELLFCTGLVFTKPLPELVLRAI